MICSFCGGSGKTYSPKVRACSVCHGAGQLEENTIPKVDFLPRDLAECVRLLLRSSWRDIDSRYEHLTEQEKACLTEEQFDRLKKWVQ